MKRILFILFLIFSFSILRAQEEAVDSKNPIEIGIEYQMYPAGYVPSLKLEFGLGKYAKHGFNTRVAYNITRRRDWGEHEDERGSGFGGSIGYRYYILDPFKALYVGARFDVWRLKIDWRNSGADELLFTNDDERNTTKIIVTQPTIEVGYKFRIKDKFIINPALALGWEYNAKTEGDPVGQGSILLWGVDLMYRF